MVFYTRPFMKSISQHDMKPCLLHLIYALAVSTVQPDGTACTPVVVHVAVLFLTNVPVAATPETQLLVYEVLGVVVNMALM